MHLFERILQIDPINLSILPIKDNLLHELYTALKRPERKINDTVFTILGKLGSYNRDNFKYAHGVCKDIIILYNLNSLNNILMFYLISSFYIFTSVTGSKIFIIMSRSSV